MLVAKKKAKKLKLKTHRGAAKRFKITSTGKILRMHSGKRHLLGTHIVLRESVGRPRT